MQKISGVIALLTDFGLSDPYVGVMKGVILGINPAATLVDLSHDVAPQDVRGASLVLSTCVDWFPRGTVFAAVVDPGVGTNRPIVAVETDRHLFVAPDNGLIGFVGGKRKVRVENPRYRLHPVSNTFHGRDVVAPAAAHLSRGLALERLGPEARSLRRLPVPKIRTLRGGGVVGEVTSIDRFGNVVTNVPASRLPAGAVEVRLGRRTIRGLSQTYDDVRPGRLLSLIGSTGRVEISVNGGDARKVTGVKTGDSVTIKSRKPGAGSLKRERKRL